MSDWQDKSDFEINKSVTMIYGGFKESDYSGFSSNFHRGNPSQDNYKVGVIVDYCNNPSYAWPIILESKIAIEPVVCFGDLWQANIKHHKEVCGNPLRAAMIVYLEMNGVKPNE